MLMLYTYPRLTLNINSEDGKIRVTTRKMENTKGQCHKANNFLAGKTMNTGIEQG
jgi:hypothetical protein